MQILNIGAKGSSASHLVLMFGLGMIGTSIRDRLLGFEYQILATNKINWQAAAQWHETFSLTEAICLAHSPALERLSVVWSAGKGGFHSTDDEVSQENAPFEAVVRFISDLREKINLVKLDFHYISSAGGLFEGQRVVTSNSFPAPLRPYGRLKLWQEKVLQKLFEDSEIAIYRPSSVYGPMAQKTQQGLINNLVSNGRNRRATVLDSQVMSLRDYVYCGDIGKFVAKRIMSGAVGAGGGSINFLVSSRCSSIFEVVRKIERTLNLKLQFRYDESFGNHSNITFNDSVLPRGWSPATLDVGIRQFLVSKDAI